MRFDKLFFRHEDAVALGNSDMAVILEFVRWSCHFKESESEPNIKYYIDGVFWMQDSYEAWQRRMPWLSERTIRRYIDELCERGFLEKKLSGGRYGGRDPNYYRVREVDGQNGASELVDKLTIVGGQVDQGLVDKLDTTSLSKNQTKIQTKKPKPSALGALPVLTVAKKAKALKYDPHDLELANEWLEFAIKEKGGKKYNNWTKEEFAKELAKVRVAAGLDHYLMREIFDFIMADEFWRPNAISPAGLKTKSKNGLRKIDNIISAVKASPKYKGIRDKIKQQAAIDSYDPANMPF